MSVKALSIDGRQFREALGRFASGVCVLTTVGGDGRPVGVTISAFASLSLDPPLVLFCIGKGSVNLASWLTGTHFAVNMLAEAQQAISETFASQCEDKFAGIKGEVDGSGCFCVAGALATLICRRTVIHNAGDHHIVIGEVERIRMGDGDVEPLLRFRGAYRRIGN